MNILVISNYQLYADFTASFVHSQAAAYVRLGHRVRVLIPTALGKRDSFGRRSCRLFTRTCKDGVELYYLRYLSLSNLGTNGFHGKSEIFSASRAWNHLFSDFTPDIIHVHALTASMILGSWLKKKLGVPLVVTTHGSDVSIPVEEGRGTELKPFCDQADAIAAVSSSLARKVCSCKTATPVHVILHGFNVGAVPEKYARQSISMIQVGHLQKQKRAHITLHSFAKLRKAHPDASLTLIGQGPERAELESLSKELGVRDAVRFPGQLPNPEVLAEMSKARFFVMPSVREGFGIVYLEAMACGCIAIGTEGEGIADLIESGKNGFLVPADNPESIAQVIEWCLRHPDAAASIAEQGQRDALGLTWAKNAQQYINLFKELIH